MADGRHELVQAQTKFDLFGKHHTAGVLPEGFNLFSVSMCLDKFEDALFLFRKESGMVHINGMMSRMKREKGLYWISLVDQKSHWFAGSAQRGEIMDAHERLGHLGAGQLAKWMKRSVEEVRTAIKNCEPCCAKLKAKPHKRRADRTKGKLALMHGDTVIIGVVSVEGFLYCTVVLDEATRFCWLVFSRSKGDIANRFSELLEKEQRRLRKDLQRLIRDGGSEFFRVGAENGVEVQENVAYDHAGNSLIERMIQTLEEKVRAALYPTHLPLSFWSFA